MGMLIAMTGSNISGKITKRAIADALKELLEEKPLNKVTIRELTERCGINRMTFYYHFRDIYDLTDWICREYAKKALGENRGFAGWQTGFFNILCTTRENRAFITNIYNCVGRDKLEQYMRPMVRSLLLRAVEEQAEGLEIEDEDEIFIADFYQYAFVGIMLDWIERDMADEPRDIIDRIDTLIHGSMKKAVRQFAANSGQDA